MTQNNAKQVIPCDYSSVCASCHLIEDAQYNVDTGGIALRYDDGYPSINCQLIRNGFCEDALQRKLTILGHTSIQPSSSKWHSVIEETF